MQELWIDLQGKYRYSARKILHDIIDITAVLPLRKYMRQSGLFFWLYCTSWDEFDL